MAIGGYYNTTDTTGVWQVWSGTSSTTAATCDNSTTGTWVAWNTDTGTASATTVTTDVWLTWTNDSTGQTGRVRVQRANTFPPLTAEQIAANKAAQAEHKREEEKARARAEKLLLENLSEQQAKDWRKQKSFLVIAKSGRRYRVRCDQVSPHINVDELDDKGQVFQRWCAYVPGCPPADTHLAQKLFIETDEDGFRRTANRHAAAA